MLMQINYNKIGYVIFLNPQKSLTVFINLKTFGPRKKNFCDLIDKNYIKKIREQHKFLYYENIKEITSYISQFVHVTQNKQNSFVKSLLKN